MASLAPGPCPRRLLSLAALSLGLVCLCVRGAPGWGPGAGTRSGRGSSVRTAHCVALACRSGPSSVQLATCPRSWPPPSRVFPLLWSPVVACGEHFPADFPGPVEAGMCSTHSVFPSEPLLTSSDGVPCTTVHFFLFHSFICSFIPSLLPPSSIHALSV